ncbi:MAG: hypothetical protein HXY39_01625 [Chloroflexi bacterium]|nr:hypothetical protein [Chloroflexota bacterium]
MARAVLVFIGADDGLTLLTDPGDTGRWRRADLSLPGAPVTGLWVNRANPLVVLAIAAGSLYRSTDGGQNWRVEMHGAGLSGPYGSRAHPPHVYVTAGDTLLHSADSGTTWTSIRLPAPCTALAAGGDGRLHVAPGTQALTSRDGGATWEPAGMALPAAISVLATIPGPTETLCALAGGVVYCAEHGTWRTPAGTPGNATQLAVLPGSPPTLLIALASGGMMRGTQLEWEHPAASLPWSDVTTVIAPSGYHMDCVFAGSETGAVALSVNRGRSWNVVYRGMAATRSIASARLA